VCVCVCHTHTHTHTCADNLTPSQPSAALKDLDARIEAKRLELTAIQQREAELQEQIRNFDSQPSPASGTGEEGVADSSWDKSETQRFMDSLLKAQRKRKVQDTMARVSKSNANLRKVCAIVYLLHKYIYYISCTFFKVTTRKAMDSVARVSVSNVSTLYSGNRERDMYICICIYIYIICPMQSF
jgi:hypothetical protein